MINFQTVIADEIFTAEYEIKKSVFIAHVRHVETEIAAIREILIVPGEGD